LRKKIFKFNNSYSKLPNIFYKKVLPQPVKKPKLIEINEELAKYLGVDSTNLSNEDYNLIFSGNKIPRGASPIALAYAGHQFGQFVPSLGDGRAILLGELIAKNGKRFDMQLKGSGKTFFSRNGDGRAPLGPVIREYIVSEALYYLKIPTTRVLAVSKTGEFLQRDTLVPGGILTRIASSHIRIGTFEYFANKNDLNSIKILSNYAIKRHFPSIEKSKNKYALLLKKVMILQAKLIAKWMNVGFIHGVMNTDNTSISGETIDFGPCAFMDHFENTRVFSYIDQFGRYSYGNQSKIILWNLSRFAECIIPLINNDLKKATAKVIEILEKFSEEFNKLYFEGMRKKIGLKKILKNDNKLIIEFLNILQKEKIDFTIAFRRLSQDLRKKDFEKNILSLSKEKKNLKKWILKWKERILLENNSPNLISREMIQNNPIYIARNHLVEKAINSILENDDFSVMRKMLSLLKKPFKEIKSEKEFSLPPNPQQIVVNTFCGT